MNYWLLRNERKVLCPITGIVHYIYEVEMNDRGMGQKQINKGWDVKAESAPLDPPLTEKERYPKFNGFYGDSKEIPYISGEYQPQLYKSREPENGRELLKQQYYDFVQAKKRGELSECPNTEWSEPYTAWSGE